MRMVTGVLLLSVFLSGCGKGTSPSREPSPPPGGYAVQTQSSWNGAWIEGTVTNLTDNRISTVELEFGLVDEHRRPLQTVYARNIEGIAPRGSWNFRVPASAVGARQAILQRTTVR